MQPSVPNPPILCPQRSRRELGAFTLTGFGILWPSFLTVQHKYKRVDLASVFLLPCREVAFKSLVPTTTLTPYFRRFLTSLTQTFTIVLGTHQYICPLVLSYSIASVLCQTMAILLNFISCILALRSLNNGVCLLTSFFYSSFIFFFFPLIWIFLCVLIHSWVGCHLCP